LITDSLTENGVSGIPDQVVSAASADWIVIVIISLLVILSAILTAFRSGFSALGPFERKLLSQKSKTDLRILDILERKEKLRHSILLAGIFLDIAIVLLIARMFYRESGSLFTRPGPFLLFALLVSVVIILICEVLPRFYGTIHSLFIARLMAAPVVLIEKIVYPFSLLLEKVTSSTGRDNHSRENLTADELSQGLERDSDTAISDEKEILEGIVNFGTKNVGEIMVPRVDVVAIDIISTFATVLDLINASGYSRIPVFSESFDQVKGILFIKDLLPYTENGPDFGWQELLRPPFFVPETKKVKDLLEDFQKNKIHMAIVVDEYGGSSGIVTLEDVLEEIVGEIADEFDEEEKYYSKLGEKKFLFDAKIQLEDFTGIIGCRDDYFKEVKGDADTLAGLILEIRGEIPANHETIEYRDYRFTVESISNRRIRQVKVEIK
jgi:gliding motility-associated protein GldE